MFRITIGQAKGQSIGVLAQGTLTLGEATEQLREVLSNLVDTYDEVVTDFSQLKKIDSTGVGVLVECYGAAKRRGARLRFTNIVGKVRDVLLLVKLLTVLEDTGTAPAA